MYFVPFIITFLTHSRHVCPILVRFYCVPFDYCGYAYFSKQRKRFVFGLKLVCDFKRVFFFCILPCNVFSEHSFSTSSPPFELRVNQQLVVLHVFLLLISIIIIIITIISCLLKCGGRSRRHTSGIEFSVHQFVTSSPCTCVGGQHQLPPEMRLGGYRGRSGHVRKISPKRISKLGPLGDVTSCHIAAIRVSVGLVFVADVRRNGGFLWEVVIGGGGEGDVSWLRTSNV
jgi:hypothetical protein